MSSTPEVGTPTDVPERVILVIEDNALSELLAEALVDAGYRVELASAAEVLAMASGAAASFDAAIVDLDSWLQTGAAAVNRLRLTAPTTKILALFPCGGIPSDFPSVRYHLALEKPARIQAVLTALRTASPRTSRENA